MTYKASSLSSRAACWVTVEPPSLGDRGEITLVVKGDFNGIMIPAVHTTALHTLYHEGMLMGGWHLGSMFAYVLVVCL